MVVDAQIEQDGPAGYAMQLRRRSDDQRLTLLVDASRRLACFYLRDGDNTTMLWDWTPVPNLRPIPDSNRITMRAKGSKVTAWANGTQIFDLNVRARVGQPLAGSDQLG